ncbi:hypothetical protein [Rickettsiella massiliensis]|uniref:hypothetical protein n=1 Tax=Rickettsiella massiliensis TaxID=676517 RepID=UPI00029A1EC3|nr:hypothetical protein [Rickettsiella massiliensis]
MSHAAEFIGCRKEKYYLTGGFIDGYYAPNISATGLKAASLDDIVAVFKQGKLLGGAGQVGGIAEVNSNSLRYLTQEDLRAIAGAFVLHCLAGLFLSMLTLQILLGVANIVWFFTTMGCHYAQWNRCFIVINRYYVHELFKKIFIICVIFQSVFH